MTDAERVALYVEAVGRLELVQRLMAERLERLERLETIERMTDEWLDM